MSAPSHPAAAKMDASAPSSLRITIVMGFFLPVPPLRGGATEKIWFRFAQEFAAAGHRVTVVSRRWPGLPDRETRDGIAHIRVRGCNHTRSLPLNLVLDLWWSLRVLRSLPAGDVLVSNNVSLPIFARRLCRRVGRVAVVLGRMPKGQTRVYGAVDRILPTSNAVLNKVLVENPALASRSRVVLNPVDASLHEGMNRKPKADVPLTIGYVGRLNPEKGIETLVDAAGVLARQPGLPPWRLLVIGPHTVAGGGGGEGYRDALVARATAALPAANFEFKDPIYDPSDLAREYGGMDVFCYPTKAERGEGLSVAPIEAMAAGAVPVVSDLPCFADLIDSGRNGFVFDHRAPDATAQLASILAPLLRDRTRREELAARAQVAARRFDYGVIARQLLEDFRTLTRNDCSLAR